MKRVYLFLLCFLLLCPVYAIQNDDPEALFHQGLCTDVPAGSWFEDAVQWNRKERLLDNTSRSTFSPQHTLSRMEFVTALWRLMHQPDTIGACCFLDVPATHPGYPALLWATDADIIVGMSATRFEPDTPISRQDAVLILYRLAGSPSFLETNRNLLSHWESSAPWAEEAVAWAVEKKLLCGFPDGNLEPGTALTRAQAVVLLYRFAQQT